MSNEIGYWNGGAGATTYSFFGPGGNKAGLVDVGLYTAGAGQSITNLRLRMRGRGSTTAVAVGLFATSAGGLTGAPIYTQNVAVSADDTTYTQAVSWALTNGVTYALACLPDNLCTLTADTRTAGIDRDDGGGAFSASWAHTDYQNFAFELAGDVTAVGASQAPRTQYMNRRRAA